jgi:hypothetical protein
VSENNLSEEIRHKAPLIDVAKGHMDSQNGERSAILSSKGSISGRSSDFAEFVQQTIVWAHSKGDHTTVGTPIAPKPNDGEQFVPTERVMVGAKCHHGITKSMYLLMKVTSHRRKEAT